MVHDVLGKHMKSWFHVLMRFFFDLEEALLNSPAFLLKLKSLLRSFTTGLLREVDPADPEED